MHAQDCAGHKNKQIFAKKIKQKDTALTDCSPQDKPWDIHRAQADMVQKIYSSVNEFERLSNRICHCSGVLRFNELIDDQTGEVSLKLKDTQFCRVRHCPVCQWRRSLMWQARFYQALPEVLTEQNMGRWLFLTLTVRNCPVEALRATLQAMGKAWQRFIQRKEFSPVRGWIRTTEVTRGKDGSAHPHYHVLMMVPGNMLSGKNYVKQQRWVELWKEAARLNYNPSVDIRTVKGRKGESKDQALTRAVSETLKYSVKPSDMTHDEEWFLELTRQVHRLRFIATGGILKNILKESDEKETDLLLADDDNEQEIEDDVPDTVDFSWRCMDKRYRKVKK